MKKLNNKSGFTLIEIIVVLIIVGILAAIALPNLFSNVAKSKASQALTLLDTFKTNLEACESSPSGMAVAPGTAPCAAATVAPASITSSGLTWTFTIPTASAAQSSTSGAVVAAASGANGTYTGTVAASDGTQTITLTRASSGVWTCSAPTAGNYASVC